MGAIASGGTVVINSSLVHNLDISSEIIKTVAKRKNWRSNAVNESIETAIFRCGSKATTPF
jgi:predicted phosphoribosyltransferase